MNKELSIIIVNYNGRKLLSQCLDSIVQYCTNINYEVIIVDNNSSDGSVSFLKKEFNWVKVIPNNINTGFAMGNNIGVSHSSGEYILLLNNDTILKSKLNYALEVCSNKDIGAVSIKMLGGNNEYRNSVGYFPSVIRLLKLSTLLNRNRIFTEGIFPSENIEVDWVEGSFLLTQRKIWDSVGGLDENYFMYVEDVDFCKKISLKNYKVIFIPTLEYIHFGGYGETRDELLIKGLKLYANKFFKDPIRTMALFSIFINYTVKKIMKIYRNN